jgi:alkylation response protein AidB-like acyl-CoA dehydrogenase
VFGAQTGVGVGELGIQVHGGIGFTWEHDLHLYMKRARAIQLEPRSGAEATDRLADALGL